MVKQTSASVKGGVRQTNLIKEAISSSKEVFQRSSYMIEGIHHIEEASARIENIQNSVLENLENNFCINGRKMPLVHKRFPQTRKKF